MDCICRGVKIWDRTLDEYPAPAAEQSFELEIKRSRFVTSVVPVSGRDAARASLDIIRQRWPDANHHCWAMVAGRPDDVFQQDQSDDGEPRGTAGKPMLNVLLHSGLGNTLVVVTRYFGGVKLGAGGLVRAYSQSVSEALGQLQTEPVLIRESINVIMPYAHLDTFEHRIVDLQTTIESREFTDHVSLGVAYPAPKRDVLIALLETLGATWSEA